MLTTMREAILELSVSERIQLIEEIWGSLADDSDQIPMTLEQKEEFDRRIANYRANPQNVLTLAEVRELLNLDARRR